ncbi:MAG: IS3 family transposase [bacterium]|nr:IS3 family transposase [bacterium]
MRAHQIAGIRPRRPKRATTPSPSAPKPPDLLGRRFSPGAPDRAWCSDITYIRTGEGWLYLAAVSDVGSRRPVGYAMGDRIDTRLVAAALDMAANARAGRTAGIIFHSDHGSQHLAGKLRNAAAGWGLAQSAGRVGPSADNAAAEAFFSSLKREPLNRRRYPDRAGARRSILEWLARYNTHRRHTSLGFPTPAQYELNYRHTERTNPTLTT